MTFEEWLEQSDYKLIMLLNNSKVHLRAMKAARQAGCNQGHEQGVEEVMSK